MLVSKRRYNALPAPLGFEAFVLGMVYAKTPYEGVDFPTASNVWQHRKQAESDLARLLFSVYQYKSVV